MRFNNTAEQNLLKRLLQLFGGRSQDDRLQLECGVGFEADDYRQGDVRNGKTYLAGGPDADPTPQWSGSFPPEGFADARPAIGMQCTIKAGDVLRRAVIVKANRKRVTVLPEYCSRRNRTIDFTLRPNGKWREAGLRHNSASRLFISIEASNLKQFKKWYTPEDCQSGWRLDLTASALQLPDTASPAPFHRRRG